MVKITRPTNSNNRINKGRSMKNISALLCLMLMWFLLGCVESNSSDEEKIAKVEFGLVIHGGAGNIYKGRYSEDEEKEYRLKLEEALQAGYIILKNGGTSPEAVEKVIHVLEDSPLFNAGKGAVMTSEETVELDAAIMDGSNLNAGTCAGIKHVKNPISLAKAIMEKSPHVMLIGEGAEKFAEESGLEMVANEYFFTEKRKQEIKIIKTKEGEENLKVYEDKSFQDDMYPVDGKFGTVGCAALDKHGNIASGTSTGGMTNKKWGRVGDVPIIGAGTYANNKTCAISATGHGEFFIRNVVAHDISALMEYKSLTLQQAADEVVMKKLVEQKGSGGVIGIDKYGNIVMSFNSDGMFRGYITDKGKPFTAMYKN